MKRKQITSLLLLAALLATASCGGGGDTPGNDTTPANNDDTTPVAEGYDYQDKDFGDYEFTVLNLDTQYDSYIRFDFEEQTGEQLDDAVYDRNRLVEDKLNIQLTEIILPRGGEWITGQEAVCDMMIQQVMADDDDYDAGFLPVYYRRDLLADNYLFNLTDIPEMHVYDEYWDSTINKELTVNGKLYAASGPLNFMTLDTAWVFLFNQDMMDDYKMEYPYQLVRDGKWTIDKFGEYTAAAANLNGDESFRWTENGNAVYGLVSHDAAPSAMFYAAGVFSYERDKDGNLSILPTTERVYSVLEKLNNACNIVEGEAYFNNGGIAEPQGYAGMFVNDRGLFIGCQLKEAVAFRSMESTFGLLPHPKLDEAQETYHSVIGVGSELLVIPTTQDDPSRAGLVLDALTYESQQSVLPVYMDVTVSQKGLRNDDSIDMLEYVWAGRNIDLFGFYGIGGTRGDLAKLIVANNKIDNAASTAATKEASIQVKFDEFMATME